MRATKRKPRAGRPSKLTPAVTLAVIRALEGGASAKEAAAAAGIDEATFHRWMARGARGERRFRAFRSCVSRAHERFERRQREEIVERHRRFLDELYGPLRALRAS